MVTKTLRTHTHTHRESASVKRANDIKRNACRVSCEDMCLYVVWEAISYHIRISLCAFMPTRPSFSFRHFLPLYILRSCNSEYRNSSLDRCDLGLKKKRNFNRKRNSFV